MKYVPPYAKKTTLEAGEREDIPDTIKYITTQPLDQRKNGFGTKDANKRDEFCNDIRAEQYREILRKEKMMSGESAEVIQQRLTKMLEDRDKFNATLHTGSHDDAGATGFSYSQRVRQYDIGRTRVTPFDPRSTKDAYYQFEHTRPKRFGDGPKPISYDIGDAAWTTTYRPPQHGGKSEVKNFYDKSHLNVTSH